MPNGNTLVFTGTNFYTVGYKATGSYREIAADKVVIDSATQATLTWDSGVPIFTKTDQTRDERANIVFQLENTNNFYKANNAKGTVRDFVNEFKMASSSKNLVCSFNGGCDFEMTGTAGVKTLFDNDPTKSFINVCEQKCVYDKAASTPTSIKCKLPAIPTTYSN